MLRVVSLLSSAAILAFAAVPAQAAQLSAFGIGTALDPDGYCCDVQQVTTGTGLIQGSLSSTTYANVQTSIGVNKLEIGVGGGDSDQFATSAWSEHFIVDPTATGPVNLSFSIRIDGFTSSTLGYVDDEPEYNYHFKALRGPAGSLFVDGGDYSNLKLKQTITGPAGNTTRYLNIDEGNNAYGTTVQPNGNVITSGYNGEEDAYYIQQTLPNNVPLGLMYTSAGYRQSVFYGPYGALMPYNSSPAIANSYNNLVASNAFLDTDSLCGTALDYCGALPNGIDQTLTLNFTLNPGDQFNIVGAFMVEDLTNGSINFFNTAKLTEITSTAAITSDSGIFTLADAGKLTLQTNGGFAFTPSAVPEPAAWAMMIGGFGLVGGAMRRKATAARAALA